MVKLTEIFMKQLLFALLCLLLTGTAWAQQQVTPIIPFSTPAPLIQVTPDANDARAASCAAPMLPHFVPYVVRAGDRLGDLIADSTAITVTQLAVLNCLDDPDALPIGATIWLPGAASTPEAAATSVVTEAVTSRTDCPDRQPERQQRHHQQHRQRDL